MVAQREKGMQEKEQESGSMKQELWFFILNS